MRRAARRDVNHAELVASLRALGYSVLDLGAVGHGCPDLLVARRGRTALVEVKRPRGPKGGGGGRLTPDQERFLADWRGDVIVARGLEDVVKGV